MKLLNTLILMLAVAVLWTPGTAMAQANGAGALGAGRGMTMQEVGAVLTANGLAVEYDTDGVGDAMLYSQMSGLNFSIVGFECSAARCPGFMFSAAFEIGGDVTVTTMNEFNENIVAGRGYIDDAGDGVVEHFFTVLDAGDSDIVLENLMLWDAIMAAFALDIGYFSAGS